MAATTGTSNGFFSCASFERKCSQIYSLFASDFLRCWSLSSPSGKQWRSNRSDAADVSMALRKQGWSPYTLRLETEQNAWVALVMDWQRAA